MNWTWSILAKNFKFGGVGGFLNKANGATVSLVCFFFNPNNALFIVAINGLAKLGC